MENSHKRLFFIILVPIAVAIASVIGFLAIQKAYFNFSGGEISSFEECALKNPVMESYPRQCNANGQTFRENIGNELEKDNLIRIQSPRPNSAISSPLKISGVARGYWFFEASFPVELQDANKNKIASGIAQAKSDWMTESFVPFEASLNFEKPATKTGFLILKKDNPSGMPEKDDQLIVPIRF